MLTATAQLNGRLRILTPYRIETPEPTATKFGRIDYAREVTHTPNLVQSHPLGTSEQMVKYNVLCRFIYTIFSQGVFTGQTPWRIFTRDSSKDVKSRQDVPFRVTQIKFNIKPRYIPKTVKIWPKNWTSRLKTLNRGNATSNYTFNLHRSPSEFQSE